MVFHADFLRRTCQVRERVDIFSFFGTPTMFINHHGGHQALWTVALILCKACLALTHIRRYIIMQHQASLFFKMFPVWWVKIMPLILIFLFPMTITSPFSFFMYCLGIDFQCPCSWSVVLGYFFHSFWRGFFLQVAYSLLSPQCLLPASLWTTCLALKSSCTILPLPSQKLSLIEPTLNCDFCFHCSSSTAFWKAIRAFPNQ